MINLNYIYSIVLSLFLSGAIGYEREVQKKPAGLRDVMLVCLGATVFTIISLILREVADLDAGLRYDLGRIIGEIVVGVGFLGGGIILFYKGEIEGVTTASTLWAVVSIGILSGLQQWWLAVIVSVSIWLILKLKYVKIGLYDKEK